MDEYGCDSSVVWNICSDISLANAFLSVYYWDYLQVGLFGVAYYCSAGVYWSLDQIEDL